MVTGNNIRKIVYFFLRRLILSNPGETPHYAAFHLGIHCLPKYPILKGLMNKGLIGLIGKPSIDLDIRSFRLEFATSNYRCNFLPVNCFYLQTFHCFNEMCNL